MHSDALKSTGIGAVPPSSPEPPATAGPRATDEPPALPVADPGELLALEARALLDAASRREPITAARAHRFARAVIESMAIGPAALGVLDGGVLAGARLVELAGAVLKAASGVAAARSCAAGA